VAHQQQLLGLASLGQASGAGLFGQTTRNDLLRQHEAQQAYMRQEVSFFGRPCPAAPSLSDLLCDEGNKKPKTIRQELQEEVNEWLKDTV